MINRSFAPWFAFLILIAVPVTVSAADAPAKSTKPQRIAQGKTINLADYIVPGKTTVFDFTSEFCPPCRALAPMLEKVHQTKADVVVVAVDINRPDVRGIDWKSPVAQQFGLHSIPHLKVYGPDGKLVAEDSTTEYKGQAMVSKWFK